MSKKVILLTDAGIDGAYAIALALFDPQLEVLALAASAGNVSSEQATTNVQLLVEYFDPPKWPRRGAALPVSYPIDGTHLHGKGGLGGIEFPKVELHHPHLSDKMIVDEVHQNPGEVSIIVLGPLTVLSSAIQRDGELPKLFRHLIIVGGARHEPGNASAVAEFHFCCDPQAASHVLHCRAPITLIPLDTSRRALFSPAELAEMPRGNSRTCQFLRRITPHGIDAMERHYGIEGFRLEDVLGICAASIPSAFKTQPMTVDVETRGELTKGMSVFDQRPDRKPVNVDLAVDVDMKAVRVHMRQIFDRLADQTE